MPEPRPITVDELRPFFAGHEIVLELALTRYHLAVAQQSLAPSTTQPSDTQAEGS